MNIGMTRTSRVDDVNSWHGLHTLRYIRFCLTLVLQVQRRYALWVSDGLPYDSQSASALPPERPVREHVRSSRTKCCSLFDSTDRGVCICKHRLSTGGMEEICEYLDRQGS